MGGVWTGVRERVLALRGAPNRAAVFGAEFGTYGHGFELSPVLTEEQVSAVERGLGHTFPAEFRSFLLEVGAGGAGPDYGLFPVKPPAAPGDTAAVPPPGPPPFRPELTQELDAHERAEPQRPDYSDDDAFLRAHRAWDARWETLHDTLSDGTFCVGEQGCAYYTLLAVTGPERGTMWDDVRAVGEGVLPIRHRDRETGNETERVTFAEWYLGWLHRAERVATRVRNHRPTGPVGM
ncbi:SMI1/KNR4 family protein [Streptomyces sp. NPDC050658]|uniref:SMI1/KNR4 family protein n=1 Tax=unclassified Streptomyces TaxID=2593676 RepID=UPI00342801AA